MEVYYVDSQSGCVDNDLEKAFMFALVKAEISTNTSRVVLVVNSKQNMGWFTRLKPLSNFTERQLLQGVKIQALEKSTQVVVSSIRDFQPRNGDIVLYISMKSEDAIRIDGEQHYLDTIRIAIPMLPNSLDLWKDLWEAKIFNPNVSKDVVEHPSYNVLECLVTKALDQMDSASYKGNTNSSDEERIKTIIRSLYHYDKDLNSNAIAAYLNIKHNWKPERAIYAKELYDKLIIRKSFAGGEKTGHAARIKEWKNQCIK